MAEPKALATTGELAALLGAELTGPADIAIHGVSGIDDASAGDLTFVRSARYAGRWATSRASAAVVTRGVEIAGHDPARRALLVVDDADRAMLTLLQAAADRAAPPRPAPGIHPAAVVDGSATIAATASIGPGAVVGADAVVGEHCVIGPNCVLAPGVRVGDGTVLHANVSLRAQTKIGKGCEIHGGAVLGSDGFGFLPGPQGPVKVPHLGGVTVGSGVEIGANTAIDRGKFGDTTIGDASKIDNLVQIGHSTRIGRAVIICGCCAIGGSVEIGDGAVLGGAIAIRDNVKIGPGTEIGGGSLLVNDVKAGNEPWFGSPIRPVSLTHRIWASLVKLPEIRVRVRDLARRVEHLEQATRKDAD